MINPDAFLNKFWLFMADQATAFVKNDVGPSDDTNTTDDLGQTNNLYTSFLHVPIWKCGNNNIRHNLEKILPGSKSVAISINQGSTEERWREYIGNQGRNFQSACIVAVVRDPVSHFLSGYNEYEHRLNNEVGTNTKEQRRWSGNPVNFERFSFGTKGRFEQFVVDFLNGPNQNKVFDYWNNLYHMFSMTGMLTRLYQIHRRKLTGYLPSVNDLETNYPSFLNETCPGVLPESAYEPWKKEDRVFHESEADELGFRSATNAVWESGGRTARALCFIHAIDYACFDKIPVPDICIEVYLGEPFLNGVLSSRL